MLWMMSAMLLVLWLVGMVSGHTMGAGIHVLLVLAIVAVCASLVRPPHTRDTIRFQTRSPTASEW